MEKSRQDKRAGLASYGGSKTGGHSHGTRTHQQVLVMDAILGLRVTGDGDKRRREGQVGVGEEAGGDE